MTDPLEFWPRSPMRKARLVLMAEAWPGGPRVNTHWKTYGGMKPENIGPTLRQIIDDLEAEYALLPETHKRKEPS